MLDIKYIRAQPDEAKTRLEARGEKGARVDELLALDEKRRALVTEVEQLQSQRNAASKEIGALMGQGNKDEAEGKKAEVREIGDRITALNEEKDGAEKAFHDLLLTLPNLAHETAPVGLDESANTELKTHGEKPAFNFEPKSHLGLCDTLGLIDFERGAKLAGSGFLLYTGWGARLERAMIQFLLDLHVHEHGYTEISPPFMVYANCMEGVGQFPKFLDQAYAIQEGLDSESLGKRYLIPTAEAPVANLHREEILNADELPKNYCAYSPCFRAEAGAAGMATRGMIRVHQFDKVELIKVVKPEDGYTALEDMLANAEKVLQLLGLHYRVVTLSTGDMGFAAAKTYDIEVWAPGQGGYLEVSSVSNTEDFQARRMSLRFKAEEGGNQHPHVLNGSGVALARLFVAVIETHQQTDGSIAIPEPLRDYLKADRIAP
ncbi:MAG: serine--tRNA ligase [Verrucomicrobiales bacterium]|nr:serine--tRNA ligase [Verrucomicrobiales bacterium]|tara:strand:- start:33527 stop:34825 length:1299 start_codon:yes stop_codon:yes gene_type:complete